MEKQKQKPVKKIRVGVLSATIWENKSSEGKKFANINLERSYKDTEGNWKNTTSLRQSDLPAASLVLTEAFRYLVDQQSEA